jgi:hypothetical protein
VPWPVTEGDQEPGGAQGAVADGRRVQDGPRARAGSMAPRLSTETREVGPRDVLIDIAYCGICHTDIHTVRGEWGCCARR